MEPPPVVDLVRLLLGFGRKLDPHGQEARARKRSNHDAGVHRTARIYIGEPPLEGLVQTGAFLIVEAIPPGEEHLVNGE